MICVRVLFVLVVVPPVLILLSPLVSMNYNESIAKKWFQKVWCDHDSDAIKQMMTPNARVRGVNPTQDLSVREFSSLHRHFVARYPDIQIQITKCIAQGESVAIQARVTGTHTETKRPIDFFGTSIMVFQGRKIRETFETWDFASMLVQNGALSPTIFAQELIAY